MVAFQHPDNRLQPSGGEPGSEVFPYVSTTYRLTEHHTAGGMSRWLPYLSELQPEFFCEVSPELAAERGLEHLGWATIVTARTRSRRGCWSPTGCRRSPCRDGGCTRSGCPTTGAATASAPATRPTTCRTSSLDPNVHIQEVKAFACDIRPGPPAARAGPGRAGRDYQRRAGITDETGTEM